MGAQARTPFPLLALCAALVFFPLVAAINWQASYGFYVALVLIALSDAGRHHHLRLEYSWPTMAKWLALLLSTMVHASADGQIANFISLLLADVAVLMAIRRYAWDVDFSRPFFRMLLWAMIVGAVVGVVFSTIFASSLGWANPAQDFLSHGRVRIYSPPFYGHSILADFAFVAGLLAVSNVGRHGTSLRLTIAAAAILTLVTTNTATSWLFIGVLLGVYGAEGPLGRVRYVIYAALAAVAVVGAANPDLIQSVMRFVRFQIMHREAVIYGDDLTAGRQLLNRLYLEAIQTHPWFGIGHDAPLMRYGTQVVKGRLLNFSVSESPFRFAAEYGAPTGLALLAFVLAPLRTSNAADRGARIMAIGLSAGMLVFMSSNTLFSQAHTPQYILYGSLLLIVSARQFRGAAAPAPRQATAPSFVPARA